MTARPRGGGNPSTSREEIVQLIIGSLATAFIVVFVLPVAKVTFADVALIFLGSGTVAYGLSKFLVRGKAIWLIIALIGAALVFITLGYLPWKLPV